MKVTQLCLTLCDPMDYTVKGVLQARILQWAAYLFSSVPGASMGNPTHGKGHEERGLIYTKAGSGLRGPCELSQASTPKTRVCLLYCVMFSTYSSDMTGGLSPTTFL